MAALTQEAKDLFEKVHDVVFTTASIDAQPNACIVAMKFVIDDETIYLSDQFFNKTLVCTVRSFTGRVVRTFPWAR